MDWLIKTVTKGIWSFFAEVATSLLNQAYEAIIDCIIKLSDINRFVETSEFLKYSQAIAGGLLILAVAWRVLKIQAGIRDEDKSIGKLAMKIMFAGVGIFMLPYILVNIMIPINNNMVKLIQSMSTDFLNGGYSADKFIDGIGLSKNLLSMGGDMILLFLVLGVAFLALGVAGAIRYIELVICVIISPFSAISFINDGEGVTAWAKESVCITFTQSVQVLLLELLMRVIESNSSKFIIGLISIGCVVVIIKGPKILRSYLYSSGVGSTAVGAAGGAGRMAVMKMIMKSAKPI